MKKVLILILSGLIIMLGSTVLAQSQLPANYLVIGDKIIDLTYAMENKDSFNAILIKHLQLGGSIDALYASIAGSFADAYGNIKTEEQKLEVLNVCTTIIDKENPDGAPMEPQPHAIISVQSLSFGPSTIFKINVINVENIDGAIGFILGEETNESVLFGEEGVYSSLEDFVNIYIIDATGKIIAKGIIVEEGVDITVPLKLVDFTDPTEPDDPIKDEFRVLSIK